jgi:hypothetical protein
MFSSDEALRLAISDLRGWTIYVRCDRCSRRAGVPLRPLIRRDDRRLVANIVTALRCRKCRSTPAAAMLTNARDPSDIRAWLNHETRKGHTQILLWDDGGQR